MLFDELDQDLSEIQKNVEARLAEIPEGEYTNRRITVRDKWLLSSALQKLIRRGEAERAVQVAFALQALDRTYLPRRLPIIALEDVGVADLILCFDVLHVFRRRPSRGGEPFEPDEVLANLVYRLARSTKSRALCDLLCLAHEKEKVRFQVEKLAAARPERVIKVVLDPSARDTRRALGLQLLSGLTVSQGPWRRTVSRFQAQALKLIAERMELPPVVRWLFENGRNTSGLAAMLPLVLEALRGEDLDLRSWRQDDREGDIAGLPACAFDMHTALGRQAIREFAALLYRKRHWLPGATRSRFAEVIAMGLFHTEGSKLDRRLGGAWLEELRERCERAELESRGLRTEEARRRLYRVLALEAETLWEMRNQTAIRLLSK